MGGISSVLGTVALLGFLAFLAGVGLVVVSASQGRPVRGGVLLAIVGLVFGLVLSVVAQGIIVVAPQERAVVFQTISGELGQPRGPGTHIIIPVIQDATTYDIGQQEYTMAGQREEGNRLGDDAVEARTLDGQIVLVDVTVIYSVDTDPENLNELHIRWRSGYEENFVRPTVRGIAREVIAGFEAEDIYGERRADMETEMQQRISDRFLEESLLLNDLLVRNIQFSDEFTNSIEQAQIAAQQAERARLQVLQRQREAQQAVAVAEGERDAEVTRAEGSAQATILQAQAQAEALRLVSQQIAANPLLIQYEYVSRLSENVNIALVPSNSPFLFDFESLGSGSPNFSAPEVPDPEDVLPESERIDPNDAANNGN